MGAAEERGLEKRLGVAFKDPGLLRLALVHRSFMFERPQEAPESNERLEFLGDAFLGMVIAHELYRRFSEEPEGRLTEMRSRFVRTEMLADIARSLGLGDLLYLGKGEEATGGRTRVRNLARVMEAVIGAVFLDQGYRTARRLVVGLLRERLDSLSDERFTNHKSLLQEAAQASGASHPVYRVQAAQAGEAAPRFTVQVIIEGAMAGEGQGESKLLAEQDAARDALRRFERRGSPGPNS